MANTSANTVTFYAAPYTGSATTISNGVNFCQSLAFDAAGNLFVGNYGGNNVGVYATPYSGAPATTITTGSRSVAAGSRFGRQPVRRQRE